MSRTLYTTCPIGATEWRVMLADRDDPALVVDGYPCDAVTLTEQCLIVIDRTVKRSRIPGLVVHELLHACIASSRLAISQRWTDAREETIVQTLADNLTHALVGGGLWKSRRVPR